MTGFEAYFHSNGYFYSDITTGVRASFVTPFGDNQIVSQVTTFDKTKPQGEQFTIEMNGEIKYTHSSNITSNTTDGSGIQLSSHSSYHYQGELYDIILFDEVLTSGEQKSLTNYIKAKINL